MQNFTHIPFNLPRCNLDESNNSHIYTTPSGKKLTSVTTMLSKTKSDQDKKQLQKWRNGIGESVANFIFQQSAIIGTETHKLNENYINMIQNNDKFHLLSHSHHNNFRPFLDKISNVYGVESKLFSEKLGLAGTADLIAEYDGVLSIIDYKTKRSKQIIQYMQDYFIQTTAYSIMWEELTNQKIKQLVILVSTEKNTTHEFIESPDNYLNLLNSRIIKFNNMT